MATIPGTLNTNLTDEQVLEAFDNALTHTPSDSTPKEDGSGSAGEAETFARSDHEHPHDTTKQDTLAFEGTYNASTNKAATMADIKDGVLTGYEEADSKQALAATDKVVEAFGKLEKRADLNETNISLLDTDTTLLKNTITTIRFSQGVTRTITFPRPNYNMFVVFGFVQGVGLVHWDCRSSNDGVLSVRDVLTGNSVTQSTITYTRDLDANTATATISSDVAQWSYLTIIKNADIT